MPRVFISYSHEDLAWAEKLAAGLIAEGFDLFFDKDSLRAGANWETQIVAQLQSCDHMVVLWSKPAKDSDWVSRERGHFDAMRYKGDKRVPGRMLVHVLLDKTEFAYESDQAVTDLLVDGVYEAGAAAVSGILWRAVVGGVSDAFGSTSVPAHRAVITLSRSSGALNTGSTPYTLDSVNFTAALPGGRSLNQLLGELEISREQLESYYGPSRLDWRPFGGDRTVEQLLEDVRNQLNQAGTVPIRWVSVDDELFSNDAEAIKRAAGKLASGLSVMVVDPVALYSQSMPYLLQHLNGCLINPYAIIMVLPLFPVPPRPRTHQDMVRQAYLELVNYFYEEPPGNAPVEHAQCSVFTADNADMRRLVRATLLRYGREKRADMANPYLGMRQRV